MGSESHGVGENSESFEDFKKRFTSPHFEKIQTSGFFSKQDLQSQDQLMQAFAKEWVKLSKEEWQMILKWYEYFSTDNGGDRQFDRDGRDISGADCILKDKIETHIKTLE